MAGAFLSIKDYVTEKVTPDCLKASAEEVKTFAKNNIPKTGDEAEGGDPETKGKITEWQAAWNVTNAIQVRQISCDGGRI